MISVTLVAAITTGMLFAMRSALVAYERVDARLMSNRRVVSVQRILTSELSGIFPVMGTCADNSQALVFNGNDQTLHLVTNYSIADGARGRPQILELQVIEGDHGLRLIANEFPYTGPAAVGALCSGGVFRPGVATAQSFILADRLAYCRFSYQDVDPSTRMGTGWLTAWSKRNLPAAVHVDMAPAAGDAASLPLASVTAQVHVNRDIGVVYYDGQ
jgi:hypothetical protein